VDHAGIRDKLAKPLAELRGRHTDTEPDVVAAGAMTANQECLDTAVAQLAVLPACVGFVCRDICLGLLTIPHMKVDIDHPPPRYTIHARVNPDDFAPLKMIPQYV
jgi:hypothetical protein